MPTTSDLLFCSGAPLNPTDDKQLGLIVKGWKGKKIISGGTTAKIIARELGRSIKVNINARGVTLPPTSKIAGIDIVSEGVITLGCVRELLSQMAEGNEKQMYVGLDDGVDAQITHLLLAHRRILIVIGTKINKAHFDSSLPIAIEHREDIMNQIARILRDDFRKVVDLQYF